MTYLVSTGLSNSNENVYVYEKDGKKIPLNSLYSPKKEAERFLNKMNDLRDHFVIMIGYGNGELFDQLIKNELYKKNIHFLFIEPFNEVKQSEIHIDTFDRSPSKLSFWYSMDFTSIVFTEYLSRFVGIPVSIQIHPNYLKVNETIIKDCLKVINEGIETKQVINNTEAKFAVDWIVEPLLNIENTAKASNITSLKGEFEGERAILVASGPSLKDHMKFLEKEKDSAHLFSVGSALRALLANGIDPDYVLSMDTSTINFETHFEGLDYNGTLIFETMSNANIQKHHKGPLIVSRTNTDYVSAKYFDNLHTFQQSSPSVAIFALQVIAYLGFSEIYLVGQDLALVDGEYYAEGVKHHEGMKNLTEDLIVTNNMGELVGTTKALKIFLDIFEVVIKKIPEEIAIYNLSKRGAKIEGTTFIDESKIQSSVKRDIEINKNTVMDSIRQNVIIKDFIGELTALRKDVLDGRNNLNRYHRKRIVTSYDMSNVVKDFRKVTRHSILEEIILSRLTFMFKKIINQFNTFDLKKSYSSKDYLVLIKELENFYNLVIEYSLGLTEDERLASYK